MQSFYGGPRGPKGEKGDQGDQGEPLKIVDIRYVDKDYDPNAVNPALDYGIEELNMDDYQSEDGNWLAVYAKGDSQGQGLTGVNIFSVYVGVWQGIPLGLNADPLWYDSEGKTSNVVQITYAGELTENPNYRLLIDPENKKISCPSGEIKIPTDTITFGEIKQSLIPLPETKWYNGTNNLSINENFTQEKFDRLAAYCYLNPSTILNQNVISDTSFSTRTLNYIRWPLLSGKNLFYENYSSQTDKLYILKQGFIPQAIGSFDKIVNERINCNDIFIAFPVQLTQTGYKTIYVTRFTNDSSIVWPAIKTYVNSTHNSIYYYDFFPLSDDYIIFLDNDSQKYCLTNNRDISSLTFDKSYANYYQDILTFMPYSAVYLGAKNKDGETEIGFVNLFANTPKEKLLIKDSSYKSNENDARTKVIKGYKLFQGNLYIIFDNGDGTTSLVFGTIPNQYGFKPSDSYNLNTGINDELITTNLITPFSWSEVIIDANFENSIDSDSIHISQITDNDFVLSVGRNNHFYIINQNNILKSYKIKNSTNIYYNSTFQQKSDGKIYTTYKNTSPTLEILTDLNVEKGYTYIGE